MSTTEPSDLKRAKEPGGKRGKWLVRGIFAIVLLAAALVIVSAYFPAASLPTGPVTFVRDSEGRLVPQQEPSAEGNSGWEVSAGTLKANNSFGSSTVESSSGNARFACASLRIVNQSEHPLMQRVGQYLAGHLADLKGFQKVTYHPHAKLNEVGQLAPDVSVTIRLDEIEETAWPGSRKLHARINLVAANSLMSSRARYHDSFDAPVVDFRFNGNLEHRSTTTGVASPAAKFKLAADDIAKQLAKSLTTKLNLLHEKYPPMSEYPSVLYPAYTESPQIPLPAGESLELICSHHGLMKANETLWRFDTERTLAESLSDLETQLKSAGWNTLHLEVDEKKLPHLRMELDGALLSVYPENDEDTKRLGAVQSAGDSAAETGHRLLVHYIDRMTREEVRAVINGLVAGDMPLDALLMLSPFLDASQWEAMAARIEASDSHSPLAWLVLAERAHNHDELDRARNLLRRSQVLQLAVRNEDRLEGRIKSLAKKLEVPHTIPRSLDPSLLREVGFVELTADSTIADREIGVDEPVCFFAHDPETGTQSLAVWISQSSSQGNTSQGSRNYSMTCKVCRESMRSVGTGGMRTHQQFEGLGNVVIDAQQIGDQPRFQLSVKVPERPSSDRHTFVLPAGGN